MKLSICTDVFGKIPFTEMLDKVKAYGIDAVRSEERRVGKEC